MFNKLTDGTRKMLATLTVGIYALLSIAYGCYLANIMDTWWGESIVVTTIMISCIAIMIHDAKTTEPEPADDTYL